MSLNMRWHKLHLECPKCKKETTILSLSSSADGEILLDLICTSCGISLKWVSNLMKIISGAIYTDFEEFFAKQEPAKKMLNPPLTPPIAKPEVSNQPLNLFTQEDLNFLKQFHAGDEI